MNENGLESQTVMFYSWGHFFIFLFLRDEVDVCPKINELTDQGRMSCFRSLWTSLLSKHRIDLRALKGGGKGFGFQVGFRQNPDKADVLRGVRQPPPPQKKKALPAIAQETSMKVCKLERGILISGLGVV